MVRTLIVALLCVSTAWAAEEKPMPYEALKAFKSYQDQIQNSSAAKRYLSRIKKALGIEPVIVQGEDGKHAPVLAFVASSRTHFKSFHKPYTEVRREIDRLLTTADFESHLYQLNDLHPNQARQAIWQLGRDGVSMRIEVVPDNSITIAFFSDDDFRSGVHAARRTLIPPRW